MNIHEAIQSALQHYQSGNLQQAEEFCKIVLEEQPANAEMLYFLGVIQAQLENPDLAIQYIEKSLNFNTENADAYVALGIIKRQKALLDDAISSFQKAISLNPNSAETYSYLGDAFKEKGKINEAFYAYQKALEINPDSAETYTVLGNILQSKGQLDEAIACFHKAIQLNTDFIQAYYGLAAALMGKWLLDEAIAICKKILQLNESDVFGHYILGNISMTQGKLADAETCFNNALQIKPNDLKLFQAFLMLTSYHTKYDAQTIFYEHLKFAKQFEEPLLSSIAPHENERIINRRLKIGYVSPDLKRHPVAYFIEPILISHNRDFFEVFCYSDVSKPDDVTNRMREYADQWRNIAGISDEKVAETIRKEKIDILVDLAGHTGGINRVLLFTRKPAPVQINWLGYPTTTGLSTIDYRIADNYTDPLGMTEQFYTEKLLRLSESFLCYLPESESPEIAQLPVLASGYITFGCFNNFPKVSPLIIELWTHILKAVPRSRLILKSISFFDKTTCSYAEKIFLQGGIEAGRIELLQPVPSIKDHLNLYNQIDIGLDTFPYNGTTTTCEAIWMGVPVITLAGNTSASRVGVSLLSNIGLKEFVANTPDEYIRLAVNLANDLNRLQSIRENLRNKMSGSPLTDAKRFTINLEKCYREIWRTWCSAA